MSHATGFVDLIAQSRRSLNFLQGAVDYWQNALPYFSIKYDAPGARFQHNHWDQSENIGRFLYATVLARIVCGIEAELPVEKCWKQLLYQSVPEGEALSFRPNPSPYDQSAGARDVAAEQVGVSHEPVLQADLWDNRSVFTGLLLSYENTGDEKAFATARRMVERVTSLALWKGESAYVRRMAIPTGWDAAAATDEPPMGQHTGGWITPLLHYHGLTGDESALRLARGFASAFIEVYPETLFATTQSLDPILGMNSHSVFFMLAGLVRLYRVTGERRFLDWAKWQFDGMLRHICSETGWTQEFMPFQPHKGGESCETCSLADRIDTDIQLALAGHPEYWNDAQRCAFNYLMEAQLKDASWLPLAEHGQEDFWISTYRVRERALGAYVGWGAPNDLVDPHTRAPGRIQNCCGPHGAFGCYQLWHYAVRKNADGIAVNLAITRDTPWCSVRSHAPVQGRIEVAMKMDAPLAIRLPDWVDKGGIRLTEAGQTRNFEIRNGVLKTLGRAGRTVEMTYPMRSEARSETIAGCRYTTTWVDDYVMSIEPGGTIAPLFHRDVKSLADLSAGETTPPGAIAEIEW